MEAARSRLEGPSATAASLVRAGGREGPPRAKSYLLGTPGRATQVPPALRRCFDVPATTGNGSAPSATAARKALTAVACGTPVALSRMAAGLGRNEVRIASTVPDTGRLAHAAARERADVAILAPSVRGRSRREVAELRKGLKEAGTAVPIVAIISENERRDARKLIEAGVAGLVLDAVLADTLAATVRAVCSGLLVYPRELRTAAERPTLTNREKQVLSLVVTGCTNGQIAANLWLAESTIKSHLSSAFEKLGVRSRSEAAALILDPAQGLGTGILAMNGAEPAAPAAGGAAV
jgi:DNA-binding NarL/FixJ family response regulator